MVALRHRQIARVCGLISRRRREITGIGDFVAYVGAGQSRPRDLIALIAGLIGLPTRVLAHALAAVVLPRAATGGEVTITGRLVGIRSTPELVGDAQIRRRSGVV